MRKRNRIILEKIIQESVELAQIIHGLDESAFLKNETVMRATSMTLINIGELIKNLESDFRIAHNYIPWKSYAGFRDIAVHGYFTLRMDRVWLYAKDELPVLAEQLKELLNNDVH